MRPLLARAATLAPWLLPLALPLWWWRRAGDLAIGRRTGDLVSHVWAIWNGTLGDPTRTTLFSWPEGADLLPIYGGWLHTFVGSALARAGLHPLEAYSTVIVLWLVVAGWAGVALARAAGAGPLAAATAGMLLQLDGFILYSATDGRPEHTGLGFTILALAGAWHTWQGGTWRRAVATGLAGALVFVVSWEHALWLALAMVWLTPFLWWQGRPPGAVRRWGIAATTALLAAGPWIGVFFVRALSVREVDEGTHAIAFAVDQSHSLYGWLFTGGGHPARALYFLLLALPLVVPKDQRRLWLGICIGLLLSLLLALGPSPGQWRGGDMFFDPATREPLLVGPFAFIQQLPILGWFHSPSRLAMGWGPALALLAALLVQRLRAVHLAAALPFALALPFAAGLEAHKAGNWPHPGFGPPPFAGIASLADRPGTGAVLDLPPATRGVMQEQQVVFQLLHQRPIPSHIYLQGLAIDQTPALLQAEPYLAWLAGVPELLDQPAPPFGAPQRQALSDRGLQFIALHLRDLHPDRKEQVQTSLTEHLGPPVAEQPGLWKAWEL